MIYSNLLAGISAALGLLMLPVRLGANEMLAVAEVLRKNKLGEELHVLQIGTAAYLDLLKVYQSSVSESLETIEQLVELQNILREKNTAAERILGLTINEFVDDYALFEFIDYLRGEESGEKIAFPDQIDHILSQNRLPESEILSDALGLCCISFESWSGKPLSVETLITGEMRIKTNSANIGSRYAYGHDSRLTGLHKENASDYLVGLTLIHIQRGRTSRWVRELLESDRSFLTLDPSGLHKKIEKMLQDKETDYYIETGMTEAMYAKNLLLQKKFYGGIQDEKEILKETGVRPYNDALLEIDRRTLLTHRFIPFLEKGTDVWLPDFFAHSIVDRLEFYSIPIFYKEGVSAKSVESNFADAPTNNSLGDIEDNTNPKKRSDHLGRFEDEPSSGSFWYFLVILIALSLIVFLFYKRRAHS